MTAYLRKGTAEFELGPQTTHEDQIADCVLFIKFCDKYDIGELASAVAGILEGLLSNDGPLDIEPDDISSFAALLHPENRVLHVIYRAIVQQLGRESSQPVSNRPFRALVARDDRVALGIMRHLIPKLEKTKMGGTRMIFEWGYKLW